MRYANLALLSSLALGACLAAPVAAHAQSGLLKKLKEKAAEKVVEKTVDKAVDKVAGKDSTPRADSAAAPSRGGARRQEPLDPTLLESPGYKAPAAAQAQAAPRQDTLGAKTWHGTPQDAKQFAVSVPVITEEVLDRYIRARTALTDEAIRLRTLSKTATREAQAQARALATPPLAPDEKIPFLEAQPYRRIGKSLGQRYERRLDAIVERELGGTMTRYQFYQVHELVEIFIWNDDRGATGPGRDFTKAELALLERRKADLLRLRDLSKNL
jgi:hypothetical protein